MKVIIEKAKVSDVPYLHKLINDFADRGEMLPRALSELYEYIRDFYVAREGNKVVACGALHVNWADMAEIKSLAVSKENQNKGLGKDIINTCINEAKELGISTVFCLTYKPYVFEKFGFQQVDKSTLPQKVWAECFRCPKFPNCDEIAMIFKTGITQTTS